MEHVKFDKSVDRLFSVGDLCDRGPESLACMELLYEPWFHAVLANHEEMMYEAFYGGYMGQFWVRNGGAWGMEALNTWRNNRQPKVNGISYARVPTDDEQRVFDLLEKVNELPYLITVNTRGGKRFHIIHAELPPSEPLTDADLANPEKVLELASVQTMDGGHLVWGRYLFMAFFRAQLTNEQKVRRTAAYHLARSSPFTDELSHIISGHTIMQRPLTIVGQTNIDTGAYGSYAEHPTGWEALTMVELDTWRFYQATAQGVRETTPLVVSREHVEGLRQAVQPPPASTLNLDSVPSVDLNSIVKKLGE